jgi:hypothetical protein
MLGQPDGLVFLDQYGQQRFVLGGVIVAQHRVPAECAALEGVEPDAGIASRRCDGP